MQPKPAPPLTRNQFLAKLHEALAPVGIYLEVGAATGASLVLAEAAEIAYGVDPSSNIHGHNQRPNQRVILETSDAWLGCTSCERPTIDFGFIDGSHLFEDALRDFVYMERHSRPSTAVVFAHALPYSQDIAWRVNAPLSEWTGDVFKLAAILAEHRPDLRQTLVDVSPTGALVVTGLDSRNVTLDKRYPKIVAEWLPRHYVPDDVINRVGALSAADALAATLADLRR